MKIPATAQGIPAIEAMIAEGRSINITLIFSLTRYAQVIEAYLGGLEAFIGGGGDPSRVHSVASFFVSRVDTEVDQRLDAIGTSQAREMRGEAALAQAKLAYQLFRERFSGERWQHLAGLGAPPSGHCGPPRRPRTRPTPTPVTSTSSSAPTPSTPCPRVTIAAFEDHGHLARTIDTDVAQAAEVMQRLVALGIDMHHVGLTLEDRGVAGFHESFQHVLAAWRPKRPPQPPLRWTWAGWALVLGLVATTAFTAVLIAPNWPD